MKRNYKIYKNEGKLAKIRTMELNGMFTVEMAYIYLLHFVHAPFPTASDTGIAYTVRLSPLQLNEL